ncbi:hypothetical protein COY62_04145 [bacterium (Candidatus Howlettbacteria) CG_4_10_14_0_8_um_filter_40_9]|nr:MAG: hypothetical protein COY62_04145 [bacterium (Candidatus Howlettbacteria) CG_4_10_14_0_8_um_filter_40_9]
MSDDQLIKFPGVPAKRANGNFWCYPNVLCLHWHELVGSEQKVLDCILRHTWGFNKSSDRISLTQLEHGVNKVHNGVGLSRKQIIRALRSLEQKGFITSVKSSMTNEYSLVTEVHQEQGTKVNQSSVLTSPATGVEMSQSGDKKIHTINNQSIEKTIEIIYRYYLEKIFPGTREVSKYRIPRLTDKSKQKIIDRLVDFPPGIIRHAIDNFSNDEWWMKTNSTKGLAWFFGSEDQIQQFVNLDASDDD